MPHYAIISARRPGNVPRYAELRNAHWYVAAGEGDAYRQAGATSVTEAGGLVAARNAALADAFAANQPCIQLSDDLAGITMVTPHGYTKLEVPIAVAAAALLSAAKQTKSRLAGCSPTGNAFYTHPERAIQPNHFIVGDFIAVLPTPLRFDDGFDLKEDYDYTAQHLAAYGRVARCDFVLPRFAHRTNKGGAVAYRTGEREEAAIRRLNEKWPGVFTLSTTRPNEVRMRGKAALTCVAQAPTPIRHVRFFQ